jgi:hypothetical protein
MLIGSFLFLISALRHYTVGVDIERYVANFYYISNTRSWSDVSYSTDLGYECLVKLISYITNDHQVYLAIIAAIFAISVSIFIYKYSDEPSFSFFALLPFSFFYFSMTGLRQTIAISILLFAYKYIKEKRLIKFLIIVGIASLFHITALVFILAYFVAYRKINYKYLLSLTIFILIIYVFRVSFIQYILDNIFIHRGRYYSVTPSDAGIPTLITYVTIFIAGLIFKKNVLKWDEKSNILYNMLILGIVFQMLVTVNPNIFRISMYFNIYNIIFIPKRISMYFNIYNIIFIPKLLNSIKDRKFASLGYMFTLFLIGIQYFFFTYKAAEVYPYSFFWG